MTRDAQSSPALHPEPTPAELVAVQQALARIGAAASAGSWETPVWRAAGLLESVDRSAQDAAPRSSRGATRA